MTKILAGMRFEIVVFTVFLAMVITLAARGDASPFVGTWMGWRGSVSAFAVHYVFEADGTGFTREMRGVGVIGSLRSGPVEEEVHPRYLNPFNWSAEDNRLEVHFVVSAEPLIYYFEFLDEDTLMIVRDTWPEGVTWTLDRMECWE